MPAQVRNAVWLLWFLLAASAAAMLVAFQSSEYESFAAEMGSFIPGFNVAVVMALSMGGTLALEGLLIVFISRRKNWARIIQLVLTLGGLAVVLWPEGYPDALTWDLVVADVAFTGLQLLALYWLFTGPAPAWFRRTPETGA